jgi:DNA-binding CsgD family transcriptional regulator
MATHAARQAAARARRPAVSGGVPIAASKITAPVPAWLGQRLSLVESWAYAAAGGILGSAGRCRPRWRRELAGGGGDARARGWLPEAPGTQRALTPVLALAAGEGRPNGCACKRGWLTPSSATTAVTGREAAGRSHPRCGWPNLSRSGCRSSSSAAGSGPSCGMTRNDSVPTGACSPQPCAAISSRLRKASEDRAPILAAGPHTERERKVLRHVSGLLSTAEAASEMHISANTVKTHLTHICRKQATARRGEAVRRGGQLELMSHCSRLAHTAGSHAASAVRYSPRRLACTAIGSRAGEPFRHCPAADVLRLAKGLRTRALRGSSPPSLPLGAWGNRMCGCPEA